MDTNNDCLENSWPLLINAIREIQNKGNKKWSFIILHQNVKMLVDQNRGEVYDRFKKLVTGHLVKNVKPKILNSINDDFLKETNVAWNDHQTAMAKIKDILWYLDRQYDEQKPNGVEPVYDSGLSIFREKMTEQEMESILDKILVLCKFMEKKCIFTFHYDYLLPTRLLKNGSVNNDIEKKMISKLKAKCWCSFIIKNFEDMFKDSNVSNTINEEFKEHVNSLNVNLQNVDLSVQVLTGEIWPRRIIRSDRCDTQCNIPMELNSAFETFRKFYLNKHGVAQRSLILQPQLGTVDLNVFLTKPDDGESGVANVVDSNAMAVCANGKHIKCVTVTTYQMCILMLFNTRDKMTYQELQNETGMSEENLNNALTSLARGESTKHILTKHPIYEYFKANHVFTVYGAFASELHRVKIRRAAAKDESEPKCKKTRNQVDNDRKIPKCETEAAILRIMREREKIRHTVLVAEVKKQLKRRFIPSPNIINQCIESLIEREYLARADENKFVKIM